MIYWAVGLAHRQVSPWTTDAADGGGRGKGAVDTLQGGLGVFSRNKALRRKGEQGGCAIIRGERRESAGGGKSFANQPTVSDLTEYDLQNTLTDLGSTTEEAIIGNKRKKHAISCNLNTGASPSGPHRTAPPRRRSVGPSSSTTETCMTP